MVGPGHGAANNQCGYATEVSTGRHLGAPSPCDPFRRSTSPYVTLTGPGNKERDLFGEEKGIQVLYPTLRFRIDKNPAFSQHLSRPLLKPWLERFPTASSGWGK